MSQIEDQLAEMLLTESRYNTVTDRHTVSTMIRHAISELRKLRANVALLESSNTELRVANRQLLMNRKKEEGEWVCSKCFLRQEPTQSNDEAPF